MLPYVGNDEYCYANSLPRSLLDNRADKELHNFDKKELHIVWSETEAPHQDESTVYPDLLSYLVSLVSMLDNKKWSNLCILFLLRVSGSYTNR
jgi:hypothetical protein